MTATAGQAGTAAPLEMDPQIRARWVAALRSGQYPQGQKYLRSGEDRCCLGVLSDLAVEAGVTTREERTAATGEQYCAYGPCCSFDYLPDEVQCWAGLSTHNPQVMWRGEFSSLAELNDGGQSFAQIADLIEGVTR